MHKNHYYYYSGLFKKNMVGSHTSGWNNLVYNIKTVINIQKTNRPENSSFKNNK